MDCKFGECEICKYNSLGFCTFHQLTIEYKQKEVEKILVNPFELAKLLKDKVEEDKEKVRRDSIPDLNDCPFCSMHAMFYDRIHDIFSCLNVKCISYNRQIQFESNEYNQIIIYIQRI